jgi:hypothetical protein
MLILRLKIASAYVNIATFQPNGGHVPVLFSEMNEGESVRYSGIRAGRKDGKQGTSPSSRKP